MTPVIARAYVAVDAGQAHLRHRRGDGRRRRPIVLLHQNPSASVMFESYMRTAPDSFDLIALDLAGFGSSDPLPGAPTIEGWADHVAESLARYGVDTFDLFGHHLGAAVAIGVAARHPGRVGQLVVSGPPMYDDEMRAQIADLVGALTRSIERSGEIETTHRFLTRLAGDAPHAADTVRRETPLALLAHDALAAYRALLDVDLEPLVTGLRVPATVMVGAHDLLVSAARRVHELLPGSDFEVIPDCNVFVFDEQPDRVADVVNLAFGTRTI